MHDRARHSVAPNRPPAVLAWSFSVRSVNSASLWLGSMLFVQVNLEQTRQTLLILQIGRQVKSSNSVGEGWAALATPQRCLQCFSQRRQSRSNYRCNAVLMAFFSGDRGTAFSLTNNFTTINKFQFWRLECFLPLRHWKFGRRLRWHTVTLALSCDNRTKCFYGKLWANGTNKLLRGSHVVG